MCAFVCMERMERMVCEDLGGAVSAVQCTSRVFELWIVNVPSCVGVVECEEAGRKVARSQGKQFQAGAAVRRSRSACKCSRTGRWEMGRQGRAQDG